MAHEELTTLYQHLQETQFSFAPRGRYHFHDIYSFVKEQYPELCDDSYLCSQNCKQGHNTPEWQHRVRAALDSLKRRSPSFNPILNTGSGSFSRTPPMNWNTANRFGANSRIDVRPTRCLRPICENLEFTAAHRGYGWTNHAHHRWQMMA